MINLQINVLTRTFNADMNLQLHIFTFGDLFVIYKIAKYIFIALGMTGSAV